MHTPLPIPTGLHPSAQGCEERATLGHAPERFPQPQRGCILPVRADGCNPVGVDGILTDPPWVASRTRQPWAESPYPVGVNPPTENQPRRHLRAQARRPGGVEEVAAAPSLHRPALMYAPFPIPTGLHPSAQSCEERATLGHAPQRFPQPQRGCILPVRAGGCNPVGVDEILPGSPRVASRTRQPWAGGHYPVGVNQLAESSQLVTNCHLLKAGCCSVSQLVANCSQLKTVCVFITQPVTNCYQLKPPTKLRNLIPPP